VVFASTLAYLFFNRARPDRAEPGRAVPSGSVFGSTLASCPAGEEPRLFISSDMPPVLRAS
jgi:hypothetical protein